MFSWWKTREKYAAEQYNLRMRLEQEQAYSKHLVGTLTNHRRRVTDLPTYRAADLAGYIGRVNELLNFAALIIPSPLESGAHCDAIAERFKDAAAKAQAIQLDLLEIVQAERDKEEARKTADAMDAMLMQKADMEAMERARRANVAPLPSGPDWYAGKADDEPDPART